MSLKEVKQNSLRFLGRVLLTRNVDLLCKSLRVNFINKDSVIQLEKENINYVFAFWHGTMLLPWYLGKNKNFAALTSRSKDGDLLARQLKYWKIKVVRGSSSKGGNEALDSMVSFAKNKFSVAITPDGPRGPKYKFKAGAVITAKKSKVPLVLAGIGYKKKRMLKSWDSFQVPIYFSRANVVYSDPIYIDENLSYEETSKKIEECEKLLNELQAKAGMFN